MKLNTPEAHEAWADFKEHLIDVGLLRDLHILQPHDRLKERGRHNLAKMAFKQGFAMSSLSVDVVPKNAVDINWDPVVKIEAPTKKRIEGRQHRTIEQIEKDTKSLINMLSGNIEPMKLREIIIYMRSFGHMHWNINNGSGFVRFAIKNGAPIEKLERGLYVYSAGSRGAISND